MEVSNFNQKIITSIEGINTYELDRVITSSFIGPYVYELLTETKDVTITISEKSGLYELNVNPGISYLNIQVSVSNTELGVSAIASTSIVVENGFTTNIVKYLENPNFTNGISGVKNNWINIIPNI